MKLICPHCSNTVNLEYLSFELDDRIRTEANKFSPDYKDKWINEFKVDFKSDDRIQNVKKALGIEGTDSDDGVEYVVEPMQKFFSYKEGEPVPNEQSGMKVFQMEVRNGKPILRFGEDFLKAAAPRLGAEGFPCVERVLCPFCYGYLDDCFFDERYSWISVGLIAKRASTKSVSFMMMSELSNFGFMGGTMEVNATNRGRISLLVGKEPNKSNALVAASEGMKKGSLPSPTSDLWCLAQPVHINYGKKNLTIHFNDFAGETFLQVEKFLAGVNDKDLEENKKQALGMAMTRIKNLDAYIVLVDAQDLLDNQLDEINNIIRSVKTIIEKNEQKGKNLVLAITKADLLFAEGRFLNELPKSVQNALMSYKNMDDNGSNELIMDYDEFRRSKFNVERHFALQPELRRWAAGKLQAFREILNSGVFRDISVVFTAPLGRNIEITDEEGKTKISGEQIGNAYKEHCTGSLGVDEENEDAQWKGLNSKYAITGAASSFLRPFYPMDPIAAAVIGAAIHQGGECAINDVSAFLESIEKEGQRLYDLEKGQSAKPVGVSALIRQEPLQDIF